MRAVPALFVGVCLAAQAVVAGQAPSTAGDAAAVMASAREALGSEKRISSVKTTIANGRTRQVQGENLVPIEFEIAIELPDKYVRTDEIPARETGPTTRGFNGTQLIQAPDAGAAGRGGPVVRREGGPMPPPDGMAAGARGGGPPADATVPLRQDFARLTLGMFATSFAAYPLTFAYAAVAEAPEGKADVIDIKGPANFAARLFINSQTHLPLMVSWTVPPNLVPVMPGQAPAAN